MARIGFVGLGNMGGPMASNLAAAGHDVRGFDLAPHALEGAARAGVMVAQAPGDAAHGAEIIVTMLPEGKHVLSAYRGADGLLAAAAAGTLFIDCSTIDVSEAREAHALARQAGMESLDAPVSGGVAGATRATLTFMCGGDAAPFARAKPVLEAMGKRVVHCGEAGAGQAAKVCNNLILGITMAAVSEAFVLGEKLGLSHQALFDVASAASGQCWALTSYCPVPGMVPSSPANSGYKPGFASALMLKDLRLAMQAASATGADTVLGRTAAALYAGFAERGGGERDFSAIIEDVRARSEQG